MTTSIRKLFLNYLSQLTAIIEKVPEELFSDTLHEGMFSLEMNAQIAANFLLRGYCPLVGGEVVSYELSASGKNASLRLIHEVQIQLETLPDIEGLDDSKLISDTAGFTEISLPQSSYVFRYIVPNYMFHMSMVYAIARKAGVPLSKGDFDGLHSYPVGFSFID
ncbi:DUF1993 family protein [Vreelandella alkaliphila]|nr:MULTISPECIES: DUF1993 family protein [unclassified Halomonas]HBS81918.1 hypothetical protein [Halomonas campaniensis]